MRNEQGWKFFGDLNTIEAMKSPHEAYIAKAPKYAQPILKKIQAVMRKACPEVEETMKWSFATFEYHGLMTAMAAFKEHIHFSFWRGKQMEDPEGLFEDTNNKSMVVMRFEKLADVPNQHVFTRYIKEAMKLNEAAVSERKTRKPNAVKAPAKKKTVKAPADLLAALKKSKKALSTFEGFSYTNKNDYVEWITEAKRDATREKRIADAVEWMAEGKPRNWKYMPEWR